MIEETEQSSTDTESFDESHEQGYDNIIDPNEPPSKIPRLLPIKFCPLCSRAMNYETNPNPNELEFIYRCAVCSYSEKSTNTYSSVTRFDKDRTIVRVPRGVHNDNTLPRYRLDCPRCSKKRWVVYWRVAEIEEDEDKMRFVLICAKCKHRWIPKRLASGSAIGQVSPLESTRITTDHPELNPFEQSSKIVADAQVLAIEDNETSNSDRPQQQSYIESTPQEDQTTELGTLTINLSVIMSTDPEYDDVRTVSLSESKNETIPASINPELHENESRDFQSILIRETTSPATQSTATERVNVESSTQTIAQSVSDQINDIFSLLSRQPSMDRTLTASRGQARTSRRACARIAHTPVQERSPTSSSSRFLVSTPSTNQDLNRRESYPPYSGANRRATANARRRGRIRRTRRADRPLSTVSERSVSTPGLRYNLRDRTKLRNTQINPDLYYMPVGRRAQGRRTARQQTTNRGSSARRRTQHNNLTNEPCEANETTAKESDDAISSDESSPDASLSYKPSTSDYTDE